MEILLVEDDGRVARLVERTLAEAGHHVEVAYDGPSGLARGVAGAYDLIVLDILLPGMDGLDVCRRLRRRSVRTPILMLTARDAVVDRVAGLEAGADDYLVKPFAVQELIARLRALTRRGKQADAVLSYADLALDIAARTATRAGMPIVLTGRETALLELLLRDVGQTITRERAIDEIWDGAAEPNVVDRYVTRLRRKLGEPPLIRTLRGSGFVLRA